MNSFTMRTAAEHPDVDEFTRMLQRMYDTADLTEVSEVAAPEQVAVYRRELETLASYGLRKKIRFRSPREGRQSTPDQPVQYFFGSRDGKHDLSYANGRVRYVEDFVTTDDKRVARFRHRRGLGEVRAVRIGEQHQQRAVRQITCQNCGSKLSLQGTQTPCPACGAQYRHEAFNWLVTSFRLWNEPVEFRLGLTLGLVFVLGVGAAVIAQRAAERGALAMDAELPIFVAGGILTSVLLFAFVMAAIQGIQLLIRNGRVQRIKQRDPNFSRQTLDLIANRILDNESALLGAAGPGETLLNGGTFKTYVAHYQPAADHELVKLKMNLHRYRYLRDDRGRPDVRHEVSELELPLVRSWQARTPVNYVPTQYQCPRCGSRQAITGSRQQQCIHCGSEYPLAALDWALADGAERG